MQTVSTNTKLVILIRGPRSRARMVVGFTTTCAIIAPPLTQMFLTLNPAHGKVYLIQLYVIKFVSEMW